VNMPTRSKESTSHSLSKRKTGPPARRKDNMAILAGKKERPEHPSRPEWGGGRGEAQRKVVPPPSRLLKTGKRISAKATENTKRVRRLDEKMASMVFRDEKKKEIGQQDDVRVVAVAIGGRKNGLKKSSPSAVRGVPKKTRERSQLSERIT